VRASNFRARHYFVHSTFAPPLVAKTRDSFESVSASAIAASEGQESLPDPPSRALGSVDQGVIPSLPCRGCRAGLRTCLSAPGQRYGSFERRNVDDGMELHAAFGRLLEIGVESFVLGLARRGLKSTSLLRYSSVLRAPCPFWYWRSIHAHLDRSMYLPSNGELDEAIRYRLKVDVLARVSEVCRQLGLATFSNAPISGRMRELGVLRLRAAPARATTAPEFIKTDEADVRPD
jgi:hypothetical protein